MDLHNSGVNTWYSFVLEVQKLTLNYTTNTAPSMQQIKLIKHNLQGRYANHWQKRIEKHNKLVSYRLFKHTFRK